MCIRDRSWRARTRGIFLEAFLGTSRLRPLLEAVPLRIMLNTEAPLIGAAHYAVTSTARNRERVSGKAEWT